MRLINASTLRLEYFNDAKAANGDQTAASGQVPALEDDSDSDSDSYKHDPSSAPPPPKYAILSHRWLRGNSQEVDFQDFQNPAVRNTRPGWNKIQQCCERALSQDIAYVWIDTCCINKESSAELQEAINMMYTWYRNAEVCYVSLQDGNRGFHRSRWFKRGWTLQELLAPRRLEFYNLLNGSTEPIDAERYTREDRATEISSITGIAVRYLNGQTSTSEASVAERMSWISRRKTKKEEDMAYCMLGLFDVSLPLLYGEGWNAFRRLQEAIIAKYDDESIFAWQAATNDPCGLVASRPSQFALSGNIRRNDFHRGRPPHVVTNRGVEFHNPARSVTGLATRWMRQSTFNGMWNQVTRPFFLRLNCEDQDGRLIAIKLRPDPATETFHRVESSTLQRVPQEVCLNRMAVLYGGYEKIYVKQPGRLVPVPAQPAPPPTFRSRITSFFRPAMATISPDNFLLCLCVQSFTCIYLPATFLHQYLNLEPMANLNVFLGWAYLTLGWKALGQNFYFWFGALAVGVLRPRPRSREMVGALAAPGLLGALTWGYTRVRRGRMGL